MVVSPFQRADKIFVTNQALKRPEPKSVTSRKGHEYSLYDADNSFPTQGGLQRAWKRSAGSADGCLGTKMPNYTAFPKVCFNGIHKVQRQY